MLKPTNDPIDAHRRDLALAARKLREAEAAGGTQPYQAVRKLKAALEELAAVVQSVVEQQAVLAAQQAQLTAVQQQQAAILASIPITRTGQGSGGGFSPGGWNTVASTLVDRPAGKNNVNIFGSGQVQVSYRVPSIGGTTTWPFLAIRLVIDGIAGPAFGLSYRLSSYDGGVEGEARGTVNFARSRGGSGVAQVQVQVAITGWANGEASTSWSNQSADVSAICNFEQ